MFQYETSGFALKHRLFQNERCARKSFKKHPCQMMAVKVLVKLPMNLALGLSATAMRVRSEALDVTANNLANLNSNGFKQDLIRVLGRRLGEGDAPIAPQSTQQIQDLGQGVVIRTGSPEHLAIQGDGFFVLSQGDRRLITRDGTFVRNPQGQLVSKTGAQLLSMEGKPIALESGDFYVSPDGTMVQGGNDIGRIALVKPNDPLLLQKRGDGGYLANGEDLAVHSAGQIVQGGVEASNVEPGRASISLIQTLRQFEQLQRAASGAADMDRKATEEVAKT